MYITFFNFQLFQEAKEGNLKDANKTIEQKSETVTMLQKKDGELIEARIEKLENMVKALMKKVDFMTFNDLYTFETGKQQYSEN